MSHQFNEAESATLQAPETDRRVQTRRQPRYHVILWDDDHHTYDYVIRMMKSLFGHGESDGMKIARHVDHRGRAVCLTTTREHAELKREQIHAFGRDHMLASSRGPMKASIEPEEV